MPSNHKQDTERYNELKSVPFRTKRFDIIGYFGIRTRVVLQTGNPTPYVSLIFLIIQPKSLTQVFFFIMNNEPILESKEKEKDNGGPRHPCPAHDDESITQKKISYIEGISDVPKGPIGDKPISTGPFCGSGTSPCVRDSPESHPFTQQHQAQSSNKTLPCRFGKNKNEHNEGNGCITSAFEKKVANVHSALHLLQYLQRDNQGRQTFLTGHRLGKMASH